MRKLKKSSTNKLMILLSFILMMIIFTYIMLNSNLFNSSNIKIEGNKKISTDEIIKILDIKQDKNIFMYNIKQMEESIMKNKYIESVKINREIPNKIKILIIEKEIVAVLKQEEKYCYIDKKGDLIEKIEKIEESEKHLIVEAKYNLSEDKSIEFKNKETKKIVLDLLECIKENNLYKKINKINFEKSDIIKIYTNDNIKIILPNDEEVAYNMAMISSILSDLQGEHVKGGTIDLTYGNNPIYSPSKYILDKE